MYFLHCIFNCSALRGILSGQKHFYLQFWLGVAFSLSKSYYNPYYGYLLFYLSLYLFYQNNLYLANSSIFYRFFTVITDYHGYVYLFLLETIKPCLFYMRSGTINRHPALLVLDIRAGRLCF